MYMMDSRAIDIHTEGKLEVSNLGSELHLDTVWIVDIVSEDPTTWKVLHKEPLKEGKRVGSPLSVKSEANGTATKTDVKSTEPVKAVPVKAADETGKWISSC